MVWVATNHMQDKCIHYRITGLTSTPLKDLTYLFYYISCCIPFMQSHYIFLIVHTGLIKKAQGCQLCITLNNDITTTYNTLTGHAFKLAVLTSRSIYLQRLHFYVFLFANSITLTFFWTTICMNKYINLLDISIYSHVIISFILMQVCSIVQGQRYSSKLNENQVRNILQFTCERPADRQTRTFEVDSH